MTKKDSLVRFKNGAGMILKVVGKRSPWILLRGKRNGRDYECWTLAHNIEAVKCYACGKAAAEIVKAGVTEYPMCRECAEMHREGNRKAVEFAKVWAAK